MVSKWCLYLMVLRFLIYNLSFRVAHHHAWMKVMPHHLKLCLVVSLSTCYTMVDSVPKEIHRFAIFYGSEPNVSFPMVWKQQITMELA